MPTTPFCVHDFKIRWVNRVKQEKFATKPCCAFSFCLKLPYWVVYGGPTNLNQYCMDEFEIEFQEFL